MATDLMVRNANPGVVAFRSQKMSHEDLLPVQVVNELLHGVEILKHMCHLAQATLLESWLTGVLEEYADRILAFDAEGAHIWGELTAASVQNLIDKQVAAIPLSYGLTGVTRNEDPFRSTGVRVLNPFTKTAATP